AVAIPVPAEQAAEEAPHGAGALCRFSRGHLHGFLRGRVHGDFLFRQGGRPGSVRVLRHCIGQLVVHRFHGEELAALFGRCLFHGRRFGRRRFRPGNVCFRVFLFPVLFVTSEEAREESPLRGFRGGRGAGCGRRSAGGRGGSGHGGRCFRGPCRGIRGRGSRFRGRGRRVFQLEQVRFIDGEERFRGAGRRRLRGGGGAGGGCRGAL